MTPEEAFFRLHSGLDREGPGNRESLDWALRLAGVAADAAICDAGCGPGADIAALADHVPHGRVEAFDAHAPFAQAAAARFADRGNVTVRQGDLADPGGPYDLIWCAGALYNLGVEAGLGAFARALRPGGVVAFSEPCHFSDPPSEAARAFWQGYPTDARAALLARVEAAGFEVLGDRPLPDAAWEAYYRPIDARIARLRPGAEPALAAVLDEAEAEAAGWRANRRETGYLLIVARLQ